MFKINILLFYLFFFSTSTSVFSNKYLHEPNYFLGGQFIYNFRVGSYYLKHLEMRQDTIKEKLMLGGFSFGKRYYLNSWARFQAGVLINFGSVDEPSSSVKYQYKNIGIDLDIQFLKDINNLSKVFFFSGGGINRMRVECRTNNMDIKSWGPNLNIGIGYDYRLEKDIMISLSYLYRFWRPITYLDTVDFPFEPLKYQETFYSHILRIDLFFNLINNL